MAGLAAINQLGESIVAMLIARRNLLAAEGRLGPVPAALEITHTSLGKLATNTEPVAGLTLTCTRIAMSDHPAPRPPARTAAGGASIAVEVSYLLTAWSSGAEEQSVLSWAMLELAAHPILDRSVLIGGPSVWEPDETVQIVPETLTDDALFRLWSVMQHSLRLSTTFRARVVRINYGPDETWPAVVASRFGFATAADQPAEALT
jgi:hypothetical protein